MNITELIDILRKYPGDANVEINVSDGGFQNTIDVNLIYYDEKTNEIILDYM